MTPSDDLLSRYARTRDLRDHVKDARNACLCDRAERAANLAELDAQDAAGVSAPCWKAARQWEDEVDWEGSPTGERRFYFSPPVAEWCHSCRQRQAFTEQLRAAVREHAAAKRVILQRGRALARREGSTR